MKKQKPNNSNDWENKIYKKLNTNKYEDLFFAIEEYGLFSLFKSFISSEIQKEREKVLKELIKQIKSLQEEPTRQGIIDIINSLKEK